MPFDNLPGRKSHLYFRYESLLRTKQKQILSKISKLHSFDTNPLQNLKILLNYTLFASFYLHNIVKCYTFASCFSWYRFKVNWIGCRETINFFIGYLAEICQVAHIYRII